MSSRQRRAVTYGTQPIIDDDDEDAYYLSTASHLGLAPRDVSYHPPQYQYVPNLQYQPPVPLQQQYQQPIPPQAVAPSPLPSVSRPPIPEESQSSAQKRVALRSKASKFAKWSYEDDLRLIIAARMYGDIDKIHKKTKFLVKFSKNDLTERWRALLFDPDVASKTAPPLDAFIATQRRAGWTPEEDQLIVDAVTEEGGVVSFVSLFDKLRSQLHPTRTPKAFEAHFYRMKRAGQIPILAASASSSAPSSSMDMASSDAE